MLMESSPRWYSADGDERPSPWFPMEAAIVAYFTAELLVRVWSVSYRVKFVKVFLTDILNVFDIAAVLPFYVELIFSSSIGFDFKVLRVMRVARIVKVTRFHKGLQIVGASLYQTRGQLYVAFLIIVLNMMVWSTFVFYFERGDAVWDTDAEVFLYDGPKSTEENRTHAFQSIPHTFWWCIATLTTVGYGDMVPENTAAKLVATGTMASAVFVLALPTSIIGARFLELYEEEKLRQKKRKITRGDAGDDGASSGTPSLASDGLVDTDDEDADSESVVSLLVLIDYLQETGSLSSSAVYYSAATDEHLYRPGDSETLRAMVFCPTTQRAMRAVYLYAIAAPTDELVAKRFVRGAIELALQKRYFTKPEPTSTTTPWVPSAKTQRLVTEGEGTACLDSTLRGHQDMTPHA
eukprot:TRINITY_DN1406_c0_g2_i1.p1 TRINITY_DN1406_c0_g2~~TRINITY_DN1406_c0_g2_i1.p1  ORF type:complete len:408 (+),score=145.89 TRINITY_DN1406_c0_g2_i1:37-1260(+)